MIIILMSLKLSSVSNAYDNTITHRKITERAMPYSTLDNFLKQNLGIVSGFNEMINGQKIIGWLSNGSDYEDTPMCRASNHFHNPLPLLTWSQSYVTDQPWWIAAWCSDWTPYYSNITWATGYLSPAPVGAKASFTQDPEHTPQNWDKARQYYYEALTGTNSRSREISLGRTFLTVGQIMHLLEDMAVPAHTRNDFTSHLIFRGDQLLPIQPFEYYVKAHPELVMGATPAFPSFENITLTNFWDTDRYNGTNPSTDLSVGLAEFTNANYFSDFTIPNNSPTAEHTFPYPAVNSTDYQICYDYAPTSEDYPWLLRKYVSRKSRGGCPGITPERKADHFAAVSPLYSENADISTRELWLDDNVHNTYAKELLPRAVGYSAGLLNYFFRGELGVTHVPGGLKVKNLSAEAMASYVDPATNNTVGTIGVYYDNTAHERQSLASYNLTTPLEPSQGITIFFTPPTDNVAPLKYIVVFRGKLGNEEGAVIGKVTLPPPVYYVKTVNGVDNIYKISSDGSNGTAVYENNLG